MSFAAGLLGGVATAKDRKNRSDERAKELSVMEAYYGQRREAGTAGTQGVAGQSLPADGGTGATFTYDGEISDRPMYAFNYFREQGMPDHVAAGLVGNLMQESGADINPAAVGDNGNSFGAPQLNGPRRIAYMGFAKERGVDPTDFRTQLDYLIHEGKTSEKGAWDAIMAATTPEDAARVASEKFWRPGTPHLERRMGYATSIFKNRPASEAAMPAQAAAPTQWRWFQSYKGQG